MYPGIELCGCIYHLGQFVLRHTTGITILGKEYPGDPDFRLRVKCLLGLAFLPHDRVPQFFGLLTATFLEDEIPLAEYFLNTYVHRVTITGVHPPLCPFSLWSRYMRWQSGILRTNNASEGFHINFANHVLCASKPSLWKFVEPIKMQQVRTDKSIASINGGFFF